MGTSPVYDEIGRGYAVTRRPDPRIARAIDTGARRRALGRERGAGAGSYEPSHLRVTAVEPSPAMIRQRAPGQHRSCRPSPSTSRLRTPPSTPPSPSSPCTTGRIARAVSPSLPAWRAAAWSSSPGIRPVGISSGSRPSTCPRSSTSTSRASRGCRTSLGASGRWTRIRSSCLTIAWTAFSAPSGAGPTPISIPACAGAYPASPSSLGRARRGPRPARRGPRRRPLGRPVRPPAHPGQCGPRLPAPSRRTHALIGTGSICFARSTSPRLAAELLSSNCHVASALAANGLAHAAGLNPLLAYGCSGSHRSTSLACLRLRLAQPHIRLGLPGARASSGSQLAPVPETQSTHDRSRVRAPPASSVCRGSAIAPPAGSRQAHA